ncbi:hypothetical protein [Actinomadura hibisca]|uniref:hypothetical protein n=1 Tax=Actinomadura hibisca TaxID=68565 RepID=UPI00082D469C|nr:hypothetical protein [Actinomadura hibisca]
MTRTPTPGTTGAPPRTGSHLTWLAVTAAAYSLTHHTGVATARLGTVGPTRWADWIDLLTPYAVLLTAAATLHTAHARPRAWLLYLAGALTYAEGHGIHLAANSVTNTAPGPTAHLWDEVAGHYIWYAGAALTLTALAAALAHHPPLHGRAQHTLGLTLALTTGLTWATNALEGGTALFSLAIALAFTAWGWTTRAHLGRLLIAAFAPAAALITGYGAWQQGFPQPSTLGWI